MTELITTDEGLLDDIVGLLDFNGSLTPSALFVGDTDALTMSRVCQITGGSPTPSTGDSDASNKTDTRSHKRDKEKIRQRRYRQRLKVCRGELQRQVDELAKQLLQLKTETAKKKKKLKASADVLTTARWNLEAVRERERRSHSEAEQKRLIAAMNHQAAYIKGLRQVVGTRLNGFSEADCSGSFTCYNNIPRLHSLTNASYTSHLRQLEGCYVRIDYVMNTCGMMALPETTFNRTHTRKDGDVAYFEHVNRMALPFSFKQTCEALWTAIHEQEEPAFGVDEKAPDNDVFIKSRLLKALNVNVLVQRFISRFYKEDNRLVLVWKMSSEGEGVFDGLYAEETAWMSVRPIPTGVMLEVCAHQVPMRFNVVTKDEPAIAKFHNFLRDALEADKTQMSSCLERLLLDDVLTGIEC